MGRPRGRRRGIEPRVNHRNSKKAEHDEGLGSVADTRVQIDLPQGGEALFLALQNTYGIDWSADGRDDAQNAGILHRMNCQAVPVLDTGEEHRATVRLNTFDAGVLARVVTSKRFAPERRARMLEGTSLKAREIGHIIITGEKAGRDRELVNAADDITRWASPRTRPCSIV